MIKLLNLIVGRDDGLVMPYHGINDNDGLWLVTAWILDPDLDLVTPERMVCLDALEQPPEPCAPGLEYDYFVRRMPSVIIEGPIGENSGFVVRDLPSSPTMNSRFLTPLPALF